MIAGRFGTADDEIAVRAPLAFTAAVLHTQPGVSVDGEDPDRVRLRSERAPGAEFVLTAAGVDACRLGWTGAGDAARDRAALAAAGDWAREAEARRTQAKAAADTPANRRRGGDVRTMLSPATVGSSAGFSGTAEIGAGEFVSEHFHPFSEEFIHVVSGRVRVEIDGGKVELEAGEGVMVPRGMRHRMVNDGDELARTVFFLAPLAPRPDLGHVDTEPDGGR